MYVIELTPKWNNALPHIWIEGGQWTSKTSAEFHARQIRKMRRYKSVKVILQP